MAEVYIYDIHSGHWMTQSTTDVLGHSDYFYGGYDIYGPGIPDKRYSMCSVVGAALDDSSYNIYVFGGFNGTNMQGDVWVLTLPG